MSNAHVLGYWGIGPRGSRQMEQFEKTGHDLTEGSKYCFAYLVIDVVGSSKLSNVLGLGETDHILLRFQQIVDNIATMFGGHLRSVSGDTYFIEFLLANDAAIQRVIDCAQEILHATSSIARIEQLQSDFQVRVGVHVGKTVFHRVQKAAYSPLASMAYRLQTQGYPSSITISETVYQQLSQENRQHFRQNGFHGGFPIYTNEKPPSVESIPRKSRKDGRALEQLTKEVLSQLGYAVISSVSGPDQAVDLVAYGELPGLGHRFELLVECKSWVQKVDSSEVKEFAAKVQDFDATFGLIVSASGFTESAKKKSEGSRVFLFDQNQLRSLHESLAEGTPKVKKRTQIGKR